MPDKDKPGKKEEEDRECYTDVRKNNLAFAAMGIMQPKDSVRPSKPRR